MPYNAIGSIAERYALYRAEHFYSTMTFGEGLFDMMMECADVGECYS